MMDKPEAGFNLLRTLDLALDELLRYGWGSIRMEIENHRVTTVRVEKSVKVKAEAGSEAGLAERLRHGF